jgi:flagellar biosynthesis chaperone FliJ
MSRLATLVRVAELQEAVARGSAAKALAASRAATTAYDGELEHLRAGAVVGGARTALTASAHQQLTRAEAVAAAALAQQAALRAQQQAVHGWTAARRRHRLFSELAEREREQERQQRDRRDQQLADELAAGRRYRR